MFSEDIQTVQTLRNPQEVHVNNKSKSKKLIKSCGCLFAVIENYILLNSCVYIAHYAKKRKKKTFYCYTINPAKVFQSAIKQHCWKKKILLVFSMFLTEVF